jgi:hypothetical protein
MIDITRSGKLEIFERFSTDDNLPKYSGKKIVRQGQQFVLGADTVSSDEDMDDSPSWKMPSFQSPSWGENAITVISTQKGLKRAFSFLSKKIKNLGKKKDKLMEPLDTMKIVFQNTEQLHTFMAKRETLEQMIRVAKENGQVAFVEELMSRQKVTTYEDALVTLGQDRFITEEALVSVARKSEKSFRLDWVKNFIRVIPADVSDKKRELDKALIFDNYVVLHYDPDGKGNKLTEREIIARKDPILFGVIKDSRKLYFIGDWKDELCDLTFEELLKEMEKVQVKSPTTLA